MNNLGRGSENNKKDKDRILTRETVGMVIILFAALTLLILITRSLIFGSVGFAISSFLLGVFGYASYAVLAAFFYLGFVLVIGKKIAASKKVVALCVILFCLFVCLIHTITASVGKLTYSSYGNYLANCYNAGENSFFLTTGGGVLIGLVVYPIVKLTTSIGGYIIFSILMAVVCYFIYATKKGNSVLNSNSKKKENNSAMDMATRNTNGAYDLNYAESAYSPITPSFSSEYPDDMPIGQAQANAQNFVQTEKSTENSKRLFAVGDSFDFKSKRELNKENKKAEAERREQQKNNQPATPYAQSRSILYPQNEQASANYTNNLIFDSNSYFNNPNRGMVTSEQYSNNFKDTNSIYSEGHERANRVDNPATAAPTPSYNEMYTDGIDNNISYSNRPKKILTDTTRNTDTAKPDTPVSTYPTSERNYYRNDVTPQNTQAEQPSSPFSARRETVEPINDEKQDYTSYRGVSGIRSDTSSAFVQPENNNQVEPEPPVRSRFSESISQEPEIKPIIEPEKRENVRFVESQDGYDTQEEVSALRSIEESDFDSDADIFDDEPESSIIPEIIEETTTLPEEKTQDLPLGRNRDRSRIQETATAPVEEQPKPRHIYQKYVNPPISLLKEYEVAENDTEEEIEQNKQTIIETLANFKIQCEVVKVTQGPMVMRYDIVIPGNIPAAKVFNCDTELAIHLHAKDGVNIQPNYENGTISIEVPSRNRTTVGLKEIITANEFVNSSSSAIMFGMGKNIEGKPISGDITKMKHLLVAGSTGSGKSVCLNALIISLLYKYSPEELRIILVDPKQVEFNIYDKLPHLMINEIINEPAKAINVLNWLIAEMERRYSLFSAKAKKGVNVRNVDEYNENLFPDEERLPKIVLIIDELADLMLVAKKDLESRIQSLTQKSRAAGIHLVLATQRPSVDVITGIIKSNLPTRVAFKVVQEVDSRTILDSTGAEKLLGYGDMLYKTDTMSMPLRVQGAFLSSQEVQDVVSFVKEHNEAYFDDSVSDYINNKNGGSSGGTSGDSDDSVEPVFIEALRFVVSAGSASISMIQRKCSVGYPKAGKIVEWMENMGYISAFDGAKSRKVLLSQEEFDKLYGDF